MIKKSNVKHFFIFIYSFAILISKDVYSKKFSAGDFYERYENLKLEKSQTLYFLEGCSGCEDVEYIGYIAYLQKDRYMLEYYKWNNNTNKLINKRVIKKSSKHIASIFETYAKNFDSLVLINNFDPFRIPNDTIYIDGYLHIKYNDIYNISHYRFLKYQIKLDNEKILKNDLRVFSDIYGYNSACPDLGFILFTLNKLTVM